MSKTTPEEAIAWARKHSLGLNGYGCHEKLASLIDEVRGVDAEPVSWTPGPNEFKDWCSRWFGPDSDDDYLAKAVFNLPLMAQKFENTPAISDLVTESSVKLLRELAKELDSEIHGGAKWTKTQHTCNSVSGALLDIARKLEVAECENCKQLSRALAEEINGPTFMGEPVLPQKPCPAPSQPVCCPICHEERAHTGTCGSNDPRALCNQAPSQPAAPVGFGRTYGGCPHCGSSSCVAMQCCMPDGKPGVICLADQVQHDTDQRLQLFYSIVSAGEAEKSAPVELPVVAWMLEWPNHAPSLTTDKSDFPFDQNSLIPLVKLSDAQTAMDEHLKDKVAMGMRIEELEALLKRWIDAAGAQS